MTFLIILLRNGLWTSFITFSFLLLISLLKVIFCMTFRFWFLLLLIIIYLISLSFLTISIVFPKTDLFINLRKSFSKSFFASFFNLVFILRYGFNHASWLNWIILCNFWNISPYFNACSRALIWTTYCFLSYKVHTSLFQFLIFILFGKIGKTLCKLCKSLGYCMTYSIPNSFFNHHLHIIIC